VPATTGQPCVPRRPRNGHEPDVAGDHRTPGQARRRDRNPAGSGRVLRSAKDPVVATLVQGPYTSTGQHSLRIRAYRPKSSPCIVKDFSQHPHVGGYTRGLPEQNHCAAQRALGEHAAASVPRHPAAPSLDSSKDGSRAPGSRMPRLAADGPGLTRVLHVPASPARMGRPGCTRGTSGPGAQRSRAAASTTSRLSRPVSSRLAAELCRALLYYTFYYSARHAKALSLIGKGP
jgi:hypothetical protein